MVLLMQKNILTLNSFEMRLLLLTCKHKRGKRVVYLQHTYTFSQRACAWQYFQTLASEQHKKHCVKMGSSILQVLKVFSSSSIVSGKSNTFSFEHFKH